MCNSSYEDIAEEYYDERHITSRNFDSTTRAFFQRWRPTIPEEGLVLDLGAGHGNIGKYCGVASQRIIQADISLGMLMLEDREPCKGRVLADALGLPFGRESFAMIGTFLFDPFNFPHFYHEVARVLRRGGIFVGTLPNAAWGEELRRLRGYSVKVARLIKKNGDVVERPSVLMTDGDLFDNLASVNLHVVEKFDLCLPRKQHRVSPDIEAPAAAKSISVYDLPILKVVVATKSYS
jgi:SAM-dependent methyltransferase